MTSLNYSYSLQSSAQIDTQGYDLHRCIEMGCWNEVGEILKNDNIGRIVSIPYRDRDGDFPLHSVCDFKFDAVNSTRNPKSIENKDMKNDKDVSFPPPSEIVLGILKAFPDAAKIKGARGCLPLHNATRRGAPREVTEALIRAFPQALDVKSDDKITPRDYIQTEENCNLLLERPTTCWLQRISEEKNNVKLDEELETLEKEVEEVEKEFAKCVNDEKVVKKRLEEIEHKLSRHEIFSNSGNLIASIDSVCEELSEEIDSVSKKIHLMKTASDHKYLEDGKNRTFINDFNNDMLKIYAHLESEMRDFKKEIEKIKKQSQSRNQ